MKQAFTINLGGVVFNIDDDACERLSQYLKELGKRFPDEEREEILRDIEVRMAELLTFKLQNRNVVEIRDVEEVIKVIGTPEQFDEADSNDDSVNNSATTAANAPKPSRPRKLYRNSNDRVISGVASGVAAYFNIDPVVVRILFVVLAFFCFGWGILIYLILLIAMPEAKTKAQFLEMQGIEPTLENINNFQLEPVNRNNGESTFGKIVKICLLLLGIIVGVFLALGVLGLFIAMFASIMLYTPGSFGDAIDMGLLGSCALFLLCPVIGIAMLCMRATNGERKHKWVGWTIFAVWILSLFGIIGFGIQESKRSTLSEQLNRSTEQLDRWLDEEDDGDIDYYYATPDQDSIISPDTDEVSPN